MARLLESWFGWPDGGVWSNLVAAVLWGTPAFTTHHVLMRRHHDRTTDAQTEQLKAHVDAAMQRATGTPTDAGENDVSDH